MRKRFAIVNGKRCVFGSAPNLPFACTPKGWSGRVIFDPNDFATVRWEDRRYVGCSLDDVVDHVHFVRHDHGKKFWLIGPPAK